MGPTPFSLIFDCVLTLLKKEYNSIYKTDTKGFWIIQENTVKTVFFNENSMKI